MSEYRKPAVAGWARRQSVRNRTLSMSTRIAGAAVLVSAAGTYFWLGGTWWVALALLLAPDLAALGFVFGAKQGVASYNVAHRPIVPLVLLGLGFVAGARVAALLALIWIGHIGMDRAAGYGFKEVVTTTGGE
jgi:hypothetical protein